MPGTRGQLEETIEVLTADADETRAVGRLLARAADPLPAPGLVVAFHGDLGAGKTVFVKGMAEGFGVPSTEAVVSPTFTIARAYRTPDGRQLHHVDAYRLGDAQELEDAGFEDMRGSGRLTCVEWAERVEDALPPERIDVWIEMLEATEPVAPGAVPRAPRRIRLRARGEAPGRVLRAFAAEVRP